MSRYTFSLNPNRAFASGVERISSGPTLRIQASPVFNTSVFNNPAVKTTLLSRKYYIGSEDEMPYNNTPIAPSQEAVGATSLPLARVKKIIKADPDTGDCSNNAAFAIAIAAELFTQHLVELAHNVVKSERRPRKNLQYRDVAAAARKHDNLDFLADVVPTTTTAGEYRKRKQAREDNALLPVDGQRHLAWVTKNDGAEGTMAVAANGETINEVSKVSHAHSSSQESHGVPVVSRTSFDAVRNAHETGLEPDVHMEED